ncbi:hypothetical protein CsSME_00000789 [Camellia sinensis var. sinensis]
MGTLSFHEFKRYASLFFKEKIKTARLTLTDVTSAQLLTEEATNEDSWTPDTRTMGLISRAAFEVDDYWRIVDILHKRLSRFDRKKWRPSYKALIVLDHLLTHGPERIAEEFQCDKDAIREMTNFQHVDEKGFNWGLSTKKKSETILKLLEDMPFLKEERARSRKLTSGIKGFGSLCLRKSSSIDGSSKESSRETVIVRHNSHYNCYENQDVEVLAQNDAFSTEEKIKKMLQTCEVPEKQVKNANSRLNIGEECSDEVNHPFCENEHQTDDVVCAQFEVFWCSFLGMDVV